MKELSMTGNLHDLTKNYIQLKYFYGNFPDALGNWVGKGGILVSIFVILLMFSQKASDFFPYLEETLFNLLKPLYHWLVLINVFMIVLLLLSYKDYKDEITKLEIF